MKLAVRRRVLATVPAVALAAGGLAGCGIHEQTQQWYTPANGINAETGDIGLRNVLVVADDTGQATVLATLNNHGSADELIEVLVGDASTAPGQGGIEIPGNGNVVVGPDDERVDLDDTDADPGHLVEVEFRFANAPRVTVDALVQPADGIYADALPDEGPLNSPMPDHTESTPGRTSPHSPENPNEEVAVGEPTPDGQPPTSAETSPATP